MAEVRHTCPDCGFIDLEVSGDNIFDTEGRSLGTARCPNCTWEGALSATVGVVSSEQFWDSDRVGDVLLRVFAVRAAGPVIQVLEFVGLLPRIDEAQYQTVKGYRQRAQEARDNVMRRVMTAALTEAFTAAVEEQAKTQELLAAQEN